MWFGDWFDVRWKRKEGARNFDDVSTWATHRAGDRVTGRVKQ